MKKRTISILLLLALVFSLLPTAYASQDAPVQILITTEPVLVNDGFHEISCSGDDYVSLSTKNGFVTLDPFGQVLFNGAGGGVFGSLTMIGNGSYDAVFCGAEQMSDYLYVSAEKTGMYVRAKKADGTFDFFDAQTGKKMTANAPSGWNVYHLMGDDAIVAFRPSSPEYAAGNRPFEYRLCDMNGNFLNNERIYVPVQKENEKIISYTDGGKFCFGINGKQLAGGIGFSVQASPSEEQYLVTSSMRPSDPMQQYALRTGNLYDAELNLLCDFGGLKARDIRLIGENLIFFRLEDGTALIMNGQGQTLKQFTEATLKFAETQEEVNGGIRRWGFVIKTEKESTVYDLNMNVLYSAENVQSIDVDNGYLIALTNDGKQHVCSREGELLFTTEQGAHVNCIDGVLYAQREDGFVIIGENGEPVGAQSYDTCYEQSIYGYGLINLQRDGKWYLVNAAGEEQNEIGFDAVVRFDESDGSVNSIAAYRVDGKYGILSYYPMSKPVKPEEKPNETIVFTDVKENDWFCSAVQYCAENKLFSGTATGCFDPNSTMTRAMLVTVLWRLEGEPIMSSKISFADVKSSEWYAGAVAWAAENGIVNGIGANRFDPNGNVTREQIATIMLRYAIGKGYDTSSQTGISSFEDAKDISPYAKGAFSWANAAGLIGGSNENGKLLLLPQGNATRAQVAAILMRFMEKYA